MIDEFLEKRLRMIEDEQNRVREIVDGGYSDGEWHDGLVQFAQDAKKYARDTREWIKWVAGGVGSIVFLSILNTLHNFRFFDAIKAGMK